jgi:hypothetical protein
MMTALHTAELIAALRLEALAALWASKALARLGKFSADFPRGR